MGGEQTKGKVRRRRIMSSSREALVPWGHVVEVDESEGGQRADTTVEVDELVNSIETKLRQARYDEESWRESPPTIHRVPSRVREEAPGLYDPQIVSLGPFHHGKRGLAEVEKLKRRFMNDLLRRSSHNSVKNYVDAVRQCATLARAQYSGGIDLHPDAFVEMMVLDGCFVVECLVKRALGRLESELTLANCNAALLRNDFLLIENQIPFFVVRALFDASVINWRALQGYRIPTLMELAAHFLRIRSTPARPAFSIHHILHLFYWCLIRGVLHGPPPKPSRPVAGCQRFPRMIPCATELREAGVCIKKRDFDNETDGCFLKISFEDGTLEIPFLSVQSSTNSTFRNLVAFEQCCPSVGSYFTSYAIFMDNLINTAADVAVLHSCGVLESKLGSEEEVAQMFNTVCKGSHLDYENHYLAHMFRDVKRYCESSHHRWRAKLVQDYLGTPWAVISVIVASILLIFTGLQAIFAVLAYFRPPQA